MDEMEKLLAEQKRLEEELLDDKSDGSAPGTEEGVRLLEVSMEDLDQASKLVDTSTTVDKLTVSSSGGLNVSASSSGGHVRNKCGNVSSSAPEPARLQKVHALVNPPKCEVLALMPSLLL